MAYYLDSGSEMERLSEGDQLFVAQFDLLVDLSLIDDQFGFHRHKVAVVCELVVRQILGQQVGHLTGPPVDVLL